MDWDRYAYVRNNPVNSTDPTGHRVTDGCSGDSAGCSGSQYEEIINAQKLALLHAEAEKLQCAGGKITYCSTLERALIQQEKPITGIHVGYAGQTGFGLEAGGYIQRDYLIDWKEGQLYVVQTVGAFAYGGTPTGLMGEVYVGTSNVHGIPSSAKDISTPLSGAQLDASVEAGIDVIAWGGYETGISLDVDSEWDPIITLGAGPMYTTTHSFVMGIDSFPNMIDIGAQLGVSWSEIISSKRLW